MPHWHRETASAGAFGFAEGLRSVYLDQIRNGKIKNINDFLTRSFAIMGDTTKGMVKGGATALGGQAGELAAKGLGAGGKAAGAFVGETAALTSVSAAMEGRFPTAQEFVDNAALILTLKTAGKGVGLSADALRGKLITITEKTGVYPEDVAILAKEDPSVLADLQAGKEIPDRVIKEMEKIREGYKRVKDDPLGGPPDEMLAAIKPNDIETILVTRGPSVMKQGELVVRGKKLAAATGSRGEGLVKIIWRHGEKSNKEPRKQVTEQDLVNIPLIINDFEPVEVSRRTKKWRVQRPDGEIVEYIFRLTDAEKKISRTLSTYVLEDNLRLQLERQNLSKRKPPESPADRK